MSPRAKSIILLAGSVSVLGLSYFLVATTPGHLVGGALAAAKDQPASEAPVALAPLEVEESAPISARQDVTAPPAIPIERFEVGRFGARRSTIRSAEGGRLRIRAIDSESGEPLHHVRVRAMSGTRLADRESDAGTGEIELTLTPDTYSLLVQSKGYEPRELDPVRIVAGETVSLDPSALRPGSARILGVVTGMEPGRTLHIELLGEGRWPCAKCATEPKENPCIDCGYSEASTRLKLPSSGAFEFDRLGSGIYALRLTERDDRTLGSPTLVELRADESVAVVMEALRTRSLRVELFDTDGRSLATEWSRRVRESAAVEHDDDPILEVVEQGLPPLGFACSFRADDGCIARADFCSPFVGARSWSFATSCGIGGWGRDTENDDRPRGDSETLRAAPPTPEVEPMYVDSAVDAEGLVHFEHVSSMDLVLEIESGPFTATVRVPASREPARARARLTRSGSSTDSEDSEATRNAKTFLEYEAIRDREGGR